MVRWFFSGFSGFRPPSMKSARYKWNILERAVKPKSEKKKKKNPRICSLGSLGKPQTATLGTDFFFLSTPHTHDRFCTITSGLGQLESRNSQEWIQYLEIEKHYGAYLFSTVIVNTVNVLKFRTLNSILFWLKFCFLCICLSKCLLEWLTVKTLIRLLTQEQSILGLHCLYVVFCQKLSCSKF